MVGPVKKKMSIVPGAVPGTGEVPNIGNNDHY